MDGWQTGPTTEGQAALNCKPLSQVLEAKTESLGSQFKSKISFLQGTEVSAVERLRTKIDYFISQIPIVETIPLDRSPPLAPTTVYAKAPQEEDSSGLPYGSTFCDRGLRACPPQRPGYQVYMHMCSFGEKGRTEASPTQLSR